MIVVDLFCGVGGLSLGLEQAGFQIAASYDFWDKAVTNYADNFSHPVFQFDLSDDIAAAKMVAAFNPDMIVGGPPCQEFSSAGKRSEGVKANLTASFAKTVVAVRPQWFVMENVERAILSVAYQQARDIFKAAGYGLTERVMDASLCGVPQKRKRFFCIGKLEAQDGFMDAELLRNVATKPMTMRDYFGGSLPINDYYRHPRSYARRGIFSMDEPSPTIRGVNRPVPKNYARHPGDTGDPLTIRALTLDERAQVQTFPNTYKWTGTKTDLEQMVGNAVPVKLGQFVGEAIARFIANPIAAPAPAAGFNPFPELSDDD
jgi:DNA (cytosine-5)-methyltransferase 1